MTSIFAEPAVDFTIGAAVGDAAIDRLKLHLSGDTCTLVQTLVSTSGDTTHHTGVDQQVLFVIAGSGAISCAGDEQPLTPRAGASLPPASEFTVRADPGGLELMAVEIVPPSGRTSPHAPFAVRSFEDAASGNATGGRDFQVLLDGSVGFAAGTLFLGNVPPGPAAPVHYHQYDEVICILEGEAIVHIQGEQIPVRRGSCYRLPARILHQVENTGPGHLREIGFFVPEGTPAGAYLPDGQAAFPGIPLDTIGPRQRWSPPDGQ